MEWMCSWCGAPHAENDPPCEHCGHGEFEKPYVRRTEAGGDPDATTAWVCTECGREHPRHSPPCSRCGAMSLERREVRVDPEELSAGGFSDLASRSFLAALAVVAAAALVLGLGFLGVVDLPGLGDDGPPIPEAPGDPASLGGTALADVEAEYVAAVNDRRAERDAARLRRTDDLDELATAYNRRWVRSVVRDEPFETEGLREYLPRDCHGGVPQPYPARVPAFGFDSTEGLGGTAADLSILQSGDLDTAAGARTGVDAHAGPDGSLFVVQLVC